MMMMRLRLLITGVDWNFVECSLMAWMGGVGAGVNAFVGISVKKNEKRVAATGDGHYCK